jgi:hypothetical protein
MNRFLHTCILLYEEQGDWGRRSGHEANILQSAKSSLARSSRVDSHRVDSHLSLSILFKSESAIRVVAPELAF